MTAKQELRALLDAADDELNALLDSLAPDEWERRTATRDRWTVRETVSHIVTGEAGNLAIARGIAEGKDMYRPDFDLDRYNRRAIEKSAHRSPEDLRADLRARRQETLAFLEQLDEAALQRAGRRTTGERTTVAEVFRRIAEHQREHAAEIRAAVGR
ncbi:MAG: DinB family protein [Chloroflexota bacterium]|nr:DinB family protein [Dehalococcoidia bacterium]MDW8253371.1 DinB family protein [Chloroflexota bacterium]